MTTGRPAYRLCGTPAVLWRPVAVDAAFGAVMSGLVVFTHPWFDSSFLDRVGDFLLLGLFSAGVLGLSTIPWWLWRAGRTSYEVDAGVLRMLAGHKIVQEWPLAKVSVVRFDYAGSWIDLLTPFSSGGVFPRLTFWTDVPIIGRPILIWGYEATRNAEADILAAIARNR